MSVIDDTVASPLQPSFKRALEAVESSRIQGLINKLGMMVHPEGGYFVETDRDFRRVPNPFLPLNSNGREGDSNDDLTRSASTTIFYLLTPSSPQGHFHRNKGRTMHTLHRGRGRYVIVHADEKEDAKTAKVETFVVGQNIHAGERLQWMVEGGKYKASYLLPDKEGENQGKSEEGLLISETVVPGFEFADHDFMPASKLADLSVAVKRSSFFKSLFRIWRPPVSNSGLPGPLKLGEPAVSLQS
ncbi:MAG: hypothetical protein Q9225_001320 [Loekoesia sp. 1 TL-2023]